jgi:hypothetical protein
MIRTMIQNRFFLAIGFFLVSAITTFSFQQLPRLDKDDTKAWERMTWVTGYVHFTNHPTLGRTPANGEVIAFRRVDRSDQVVAVRANLEGRYEIFLDPGRYRIIAPNLNAERNGFVDALAAGQSRYLEVERNPSGIRFNVDLTLPKWQMP